MSGVEDEDVESKEAALDVHDKGVKSETALRYTLINPPPVIFTIGAALQVKHNIYNHQKETHRRSVFLNIYICYLFCLNNRQKICNKSVDNMILHNCTSKKSI